MSPERTLIGLAGALGVVCALAVDLYRRVHAASQAEIDAVTAGTLANLATLPPDELIGNAVIYVVRHEDPLSRRRPWFWHVAASCPDCTADEQVNSFPIGQVVHELAGFAATRKAARAQAHEAFCELTGADAPA